MRSGTARSGSSALDGRGLGARPHARGLAGRRIGSRATTSMAAIALCVTLPLPVISPAIPLLALSLVSLARANATLDVAMNAQAVLVEREYGRPIMSSFHGLFSLGGLAGAALAGLAIGLGVHPPATWSRAPRSPSWRWAACSAGSCRRMPPTRAPPPSSPDPAACSSASRPRLLRPPGGGAMADWSAVYLRDTLETTPAVAAAGFAAFSLAMAAGRFRGDRLVSLLGPGRLLGASGALAAFGLGGALLAGAPAAAVAGVGSSASASRTSSPCSSARRDRCADPGRHRTCRGRDHRLPRAPRRSAVDRAHRTRHEPPGGARPRQRLLRGDRRRRPRPRPCRDSHRSAPRDRARACALRPRLLGTVRQGRMSLPVARLLVSELSRRPGIETELNRPRAHSPPHRRRRPGESRTPPSPLR